MQRAPGWNDQRMELTIGVLLRVGVLTSGAVVAVGALMYLARFAGTPVHYGTFAGEPEDLRSFHGVIAAVGALRARGIMQLGLLILIATPVLRVIFSAIAFALEKDRMYVVITLIVLGALVYSLVHAG